MNPPTPTLGARLAELAPTSGLAGPLDRGDVVLVFLRHFGCLFARETVRDLAAAASDRPDGGPRIVLVHQYEPEVGDAVVDELWPGAERVADPDRRLYDAVEVRRGGVREMFGLRSWARGARAALKGNWIGRKRGADGWTLPTVVRLRDGEVVGEHRGRHAGDHPDWAAVVAGRCP